MGLLRVGHNWATSLSRIGEGNGNPLQCSCLENPRDGGARWAAVSGVAQSRTQLKWLSSSSSSGSFPVPNPTGSDHSVMIFLSDLKLQYLLSSYSFLCQLLSSPPGTEDTLILLGTLTALRMMSVVVKIQGMAGFFCRGPHSKYFGVCGFYGLLSLCHCGAKVAIEDT